MAQGLTVPPYDAATVATGCPDGLDETLLENLMPNTTYTFRVDYRSGTGAAVEYVTHASTRVVGGYLTDNNHSSNNWRSSRLPASNLAGAVTTVSGNGTVHALFARRLSGVGYVYYADRSPVRPGWSSPVQLGVVDSRRLTPSLVPDYPLFLSRTPTGQLVAAWCDSALGGWVYRVRTAGSLRWRAAQRIPGTPDAVFGFAQDSRGRLHALLDTSKPGRPTLTYATNTSGHWTTQTLARAGYYHSLRAKMAVDPITNRVVAVYANLTWSTNFHAVVSTVIRVATASSTLPTLGYAYRRLTRTGVQLSPTGATAYGGRITVALLKTSTSSSQSAGAYLMSGTSAATLGGFTAITGTRPLDGDPLTLTNPLLAATSTSRVLIAFNRLSASWSTPQGLFVVRGDYNAGSRHWSFGTPRQRTTSPYDLPTAIRQDSAGHVYLTYYRTGHDIGDWGL